MEANRHQALLVAVAAAAGLAVLYAYEPGEGSFYPRCLFHALTGLDCPGCGSLRALHALLHGHIVEALRWNAWTLTVLAVCGAIGGYSLARFGRFEWTRFHPLVAGGLALAGLVFGIFRNLP